MSFRVVTTRSQQSIQEVIDESVPAFQFCSDAFSGYSAPNYHRAFHLVANGKSQTYSVEACNAELRHYIKALARATRCFAKTLNSLIRRVKFFVFCWNSRQLYRRRYPKYSRPLFSFVPFPF